MLSIDSYSFSSFFFFFKEICFYKSLFIYLFLERGEGKERAGNINIWLPLARSLLGTWLATQSCALTRNRTATLDSYIFFNRIVWEVLGPVLKGFTCSFLGQWQKVGTCLQDKLLQSKGGVHDKLLQKGSPPFCLWRFLPPMPTC